MPGDGVPVIVTRYVPAVEELRVQEAEAVAFAVRLVAVAGHETVRPVVGLTIELRLTPPTKLKVLVRVTDIPAPVAPELKFTGVPTEIVKSPTCTMELPE